MIIKIKNWKKAILNKEKTIKHAIKCLNDSAFQIILVEYKKNFLELLLMETLGVD